MDSQELPGESSPLRLSDFDAFDDFDVEPMPTAATSSAQVMDSSSASMDFPDSFQESSPVGLSPFEGGPLSTAATSSAQAMEASSASMDFPDSLPESSPVRRSGFDAFDASDFFDDWIWATAATGSTSSFAPPSTPGFASPFPIPSSERRLPATTADIGYESNVPVDSFETFDATISAPDTVIPSASTAGHDSHSEPHQQPSARYTEASGHFESYYQRELDFQDTRDNDLRRPGRFNALDDPNTGTDFSEWTRLQAIDHPFLYDKYGRFNPIDPMQGRRMLSLPNTTISLDRVPQKCETCKGPISKTQSADKTSLDSQSQPGGAQIHGTQDDNADNDPPSHPSPDRDLGKGISNNQWHKLKGLGDETDGSESVPASEDEDDNEDEYGNEDGNENEDNDDDDDDDNDDDDFQPLAKNSGGGSTKLLPRSLQTRGKKEFDQGSESPSGSESEKYGAPIAKNPSQKTSKKSLQPTTKLLSTKRPAREDSSLKPSTKRRRLIKPSHDKDHAPPSNQVASASAVELSKKRKPTEDSTGGPTKKRKSKTEPIYDSETGQKIRKGQWTKSRLRKLAAVVTEIFKGQTGQTAGEKWKLVEKRFYVEHPEYQSADRGDGSVKNSCYNAWTRYGRELYNVDTTFEERSRIKNASLSTSTQKNRKKKTKANELQPTQLGTSSVNQPDSSLGNQPGSPSVDQPNSSSDNQPNQSTGTPPDQSTGTQSELTSSNQPGSSSSNPPNPSSTDQPVQPTNTPSSQATDTQPDASGRQPGSWSDNHPSHSSNNQPDQSTGTPPKVDESDFNQLQGYGSEGDESQEDDSQGDELQEDEFQRDEDQGDQEDMSAMDQQQQQSNVPSSRDEFFDRCWGCGKDLEGRSGLSKQKHYDRCRRCN